MNQGFGICVLSLIPLRSLPSDRSEMVSQLLFGDGFQILERSGAWIRISAAYDSYEGWIDSKQIAEIDKTLFSALVADTVLGLQLINEAVRLPEKERIPLLPGSTLPFYNEEDSVCDINGRQYKIKGKVNTVVPDDFITDVESAAKFYLNTPYLWGGRSPFGIDCSGFSQIVFKQFGIRIRRDASQQALQGESIGFLQEAIAGDLAFFDDEEGKITHVGILLNDHQIIHASGRVKIDRIDNQGIFSSDLNRYTHKLRVIKRYS